MVRGRTMEAPIFLLAHFMQHFSPHSVYQYNFPMLVFADEDSIETPTSSLICHYPFPASSSNLPAYHIQKQALHGHYYYYCCGTEKSRTLRLPYSNKEEETPRNNFPVIICIMSQSPSSSVAEAPAHHPKLSELQIRVTSHQLFLRKGASFTFTSEEKDRQEGLIELAVV